MIVAGAVVVAAVLAPVVIDDFQDVSAWVASPATGVSTAITAQGGAMRIDVDFHGHGGWAVVRRRVDLALPSNWAFSFRVRGELPPNTLEFKLIDSTGENVWWRTLRDFELGPDWRTVRIRKRQVEFAWGPAGGGEIRHVAALELAITAGRGGAGTVLVDDLELTELPPDERYTGTPTAKATWEDAGHPAAHAIDGDPATSWRGASGATLSIDFGRPRELGGLTIDWEEAPALFDYGVETSLDGTSWESRARVHGSNGGRDWTALPETDARAIRIVDVPGVGIREIDVRPLAFSATPNAFLQAVAAGARRGLYPRGFHGELGYWTVVGLDGGAEEGLVGEDGAVEVGQGAFSIEPFLEVDGRLLTWADVRTSHALAEGALPVPTVSWAWEDLRLDVTAFVDLDARLVVRYVVSSRRRRPRDVRLHLAVRPFQVNPPSQVLNHPGGVASIRTLSWDGTGVLTVNGDRQVIPHAADVGWRASPFASATPGEFVGGLSSGTYSRQGRVEDPDALASAATLFAGSVRRGRPLEAIVEVPLQASSIPGGRTAPLGPRLAATLASWRAKLDGFELRLPEEGRPIADTVRSTLAYVLINRDGAAIQPGSRAYSRSWIRDGSLTSAALLRLGRADLAREFLAWFAPYQYPDGTVPCCVDGRGADPVPEHDSHGELLFAFGELFRFTGDRAFVDRHWKHVEGAVSAIDRLRRTRRTDAERTGDRAAMFGLLPESISHEGYSDRPVHSYWDDFFALRGLDDAVRLAAATGRTAQQTAWSAIRDELRADLAASLRRTMERHGIDHVPGSVEKGDFDPTSTTIALEPARAGALVPAGALERTWERYWRDFESRRDGARAWDAYTPYEWRNVGAMLRLGWKERAHEAMTWFLEHRRPAGWNHWAEVVLEDPRAPRFIGDMPHTWCGSDFVRSVIDLFWYERPEDDAVVLGAGVPEEWARGEGISVALPTPWGTLRYELRAVRRTATFVIEGGLTPPPGGLVLRSPLDPVLESASVDGEEIPVEGSGEVRIHRVPARVELRSR